MLAAAEIIGQGRVLIFLTEKQLAFEVARCLRSHVRFYHLDGCVPTELQACGRPVQNARALFVLRRRPFSPVLRQLSLFPHRHPRSCRRQLPSLQ
jgi:hypothetical protein